MVRSTALSQVSLLLVGAGACWAQTPAFDRPGIGFSATTLPADTFAWEQGLADVEQSKDAGVEQTLYSAQTLLRAGLTQRLELQLELAIYNHLDISGEESTSYSGVGDTGLALKYALPSPVDGLDWTLRGGATADTADEPFTLDDTLYFLGTSLEWPLSDTQSLSFYLNVSETDGETMVAVSPGYNFSLTDTVAAYVELGYTRFENDGENDDVVGGAGVTWMVTDVVQLDVYADAGLTDNSTDLLAGFGVSLFVD